MDRKKINTGFFTVQDTHDTLKFNTLDEAKMHALEIVEKQPDARVHNIAKAKDMIYNATSIESLVIGMVNFMLAHPSEGLKLV